VLHKLFTDTDFDADEMTVVWQAINVENECHYYVPAHTGIAKMMKVSDDITQALRDGVCRRTKSWYTFTLRVSRQRGGCYSLMHFAAGYNHRASLDVVLAVAAAITTSTISRRRWLMNRCRVLVGAWRYANRDITNPSPPSAAHTSGG
jgi:hypothetical protein